MDCRFWFNVGATYNSGNVMKQESLKQISRRQPKNKGNSKQTA